jgi:hypothetical protein
MISGCLLWISVIVEMSGIGWLSPMRYCSETYPRCILLPVWNIPVCPSVVVSRPDHHLCTRSIKHIILQRLCAISWTIVEYHTFIVSTRWRDALLVASENVCTSRSACTWLTVYFSLDNLPIFVRVISLIDESSWNLAGISMFFSAHLSTRGYDVVFSIRVKLLCIL